MERKSCTNCGREVTQYYKVGDVCPHCGAKFIKEVGNQNGNRWDTTPLTGAKRVIVTIVFIIVVIGLVIYWMETGAFQ